MLLVKTKLKESATHGVGLFADQLIPAGTVIWEFTPDFDLIYAEDKIKDMSEPARSTLLQYSYLSDKTNKYVLCADNARFMNHSDDPTAMSTYPEGGHPEGIEVAVTDIQPGEEITSNYRTFDLRFARKKGNLFS
jgi:SET domain-containing protein